MISSVILARLEFNCGHAVLVSLPRLKGESANQRTQRVNGEKSGARGRACDFCGQGEQTLVEVRPAQAAMSSSGTHNGHHAVHEPPTLIHRAETPSPTRTTPPLQLVPSLAQAPELVNPVDPVAPSVPAAPGALTPPAVISASDRPVVATGPAAPTPLTPPAGHATPTALTPPAAPAALAVRATRAARAGVSRRPRTAGSAVEPTPLRRRTAQTAPVPSARGAAPQARAVPTPAPATSTPRTSHVQDGTRIRSSGELGGAATVASQNDVGTDFRTSAVKTRPQQRFQIRFSVETVVQAPNVRAALRQVESLGATEVLSIVLIDT